MGFEIQFEFWLTLSVSNYLNENVICINFLVVFLEATFYKNLNYRSSIWIGYNTNNESVVSVWIYVPYLHDKPFSIHEKLLTRSTFDPERSDFPQTSTSQQKKGAEVFSPLAAS